MTATTTTSIPAHYDVHCARVIPRLHGHLYDVVHKHTGARHLHLHVPDRNNYFCALYRTVPDDSTGAPHIMEHCVSGGSRRFPPGAGGDMYTRSLLTDVNGQTFADHTTFYIATRNRIDYMNWLEYIVDVTLFPLMELDTFLRHRGHFEFERPDDATSQLRFVGTVFNEMKAVFGSPLRHASRALHRALFDGHAYGHDAGGDPALMPQLTYEEILAFFNRFYHPANVCFLSRGDIPLDAILERVEEIVGPGDVAGRSAAEITGILPLRAPVTADAPLPSSDESARGLVAIGWATGIPSGDSYQRLAFEVATDLLFERPDAPVRKRLEAGGAITLERAWWQRATIRLYLSDTDPDRAERIETDLLDALAAVLDDGLKDEWVQDAIARLELRRRDATFALQTFLDAVVPASVHGGDPFSALELDNDIARLRDERGFEQIVRTNLLENPHRACVALSPDPNLERRLREGEEAWLAEVQNGLDGATRDEIIATTRRLAAPPALDFPKRGLTPEQALARLDGPTTTVESIAGIPVDTYDLATDGLVFTRLRIDTGGLDDELLPDAALLASGMMRSARERAHRADGIDVRTHVRIDVRGHDIVRWIELSAYALARDATELADVVGAVLSPRMGVEELKQVVAESASTLEQRVMPDAQTLLRRLAASALGRSGSNDDEMRGLGHLRFLKSITDYAHAADRLSAVHEEIVTRGRLALCLVGDPSEVAAVISPLSETLAEVPSSGSIPATSEERYTQPFVHRARMAQVPVAFTCQAHAIPPLEHPDGPAIAVLTQLAWSAYLNTEIRRGGAYGVDFGVLPERCLVWISSRRDPLPVNTYRAFDEVIARFAEGRWEGPSADDGKIAILRTTNPVDTPATAARRAWLGRFTGHTAAAWDQYRQGVLAVTDEDLQRVALTYFGSPARATLVGRGQLDDANVRMLFDEVEDV